jgi:hypothetical protein
MQSTYVRIHIFTHKQSKAAQCSSNAKQAWHTQCNKYAVCCTIVCHVVYMLQRYQYCIYCMFHSITMLVTSMLALRLINRSKRQLVDRMLVKVLL